MRVFFAFVLLGIHTRRALHRGVATRILDVQKKGAGQGVVVSRPLCLHGRSTVTGGQSSVYIVE